MGAFEYSALDQNGRTRKGLLEGDTPRQIRQQLREQGLTPLEVNEVSAEKPRTATSLFRRVGVSSTELALFTRQLSTLARSGLPLEEALQAVSQQTEGERLQAIVLGVRARVVEGRTLAAAMNEFPQVFPQMYVATVDAGERSGHLDDALNRLADYAETRQQLTRKVWTAFIYPIILVLFSISIITLLLAYVVPKITVVYESVNQQLPLLTRIVIGTSHFLTTYYVLIIIVLAAAAALVRSALRNDATRRRWHLSTLRLPVVGRLIQGINTARFTRALSIQIGSGVPVLDAMRIASQVITNLPMKDSVDDATRRVREGAAINRALAADKLFPPITLHLIASGEASGQLDEMLERAAIDQERQAETMIAAMMAIMEPALILFMALMVLLIVLAILLPIFNLNQLIR